MFYKKNEKMMEIPTKISNLSENLLTRGSIYDTFLTWHLGQRTLLRSIFSKNVGPKKRRKMDEKYFPNTVRNPFPWTWDTQISHLDHLFSIKKLRNWSEGLGGHQKVKKFEGLGAEWDFLNSGGGCNETSGFLINHEECYLIYYLFLEE